MLSRRIQTLKLSPLQIFFRKAEEMQEKTGDVISFAVGETKFSTPFHLKETGVRAIKEDRTMYTPAGGLADLRAAAAADFQKSGIRATSANTIVSAGSQPLIASAILALCDTEDELLIPSPHYPPYISVASALEVKPVFVNIKKDGFTLKKDRVKEYLSEKSRAIVLNSPNNPTGVVWDINELRGLSEFHIDFIVDEAYCELVYGEKYVSLASFPEMAERTVTIRSCSKSHAMSGWRIGYLTGPEEVVYKIEIWLEALLVSACTISQETAMAALQHGPEPYMLWELDKRRNCLIQWLDERGVDYPMPKGALYVFPALPGKVGMDSMKLTELLLEEARVVVTPGIAFGGLLCDDYVRMSYASVLSLQELQEGLERIDKTLGL